MTDRFFNELKQASKNKPSFQVLINGEWKVCNDISNFNHLLNFNCIK